LQKIESLEGGSSFGLVFVYVTRYQIEMEQLFTTHVMVSRHSFLESVEGRVEKA
jgi:hypothetical protein